MKRILLFCFLLYSITALSQTTKETRSTLLSHDGYWYLYSVENETENGDSHECDTIYYSREDFSVIMFEANGTYTQTQADNNRAVAARWAMVDSYTYRISNTNIGPKTNIDVNIVSINKSEMITTVNFVTTDGVRTKKTYKYCYPMSQLLTADEVLDRNTIAVYKPSHTTEKSKANPTLSVEKIATNQTIDNMQPKDSQLNRNITGSRNVSERIQQSRGLGTITKLEKTSELNKTVESNKTVEYLDDSNETITEFPDFSTDDEVILPDFENIATVVDKFRLFSPSSWSNAFAQQMLLDKYICNQSLVDRTILTYSGLLNQRMKGVKSLDISNNQDDHIDSFSFDANGDIVLVNGMKLTYDKDVPVRLTDSNKDNDVSFYYDVNKIMIENINKQIDYIEFNNNFEPITYRVWNKEKNSFSNKYFTPLIETLSDYSVENGKSVKKQLLFTNNRQVPFEILDAYREIDSKKRYLITQPSFNIFEMTESDVDTPDETLIHRLYFNNDKRLIRIETLKKTEDSEQSLRTTIFDYELY